MASQKLDHRDLVAVVGAIMAATGLWILLGLAGIGVFLLISGAIFVAYGAKPRKSRE